MIRNFERFDRMVAEYDRQHPLTLAQKLAIIQGLYEEARALGQFSPESVSTDLQAELRIARILNTYVPESHR